MSTAEQLQPIPEERNRTLCAVSPAEHADNEQHIRDTQSLQPSKKWRDEIAAMRRKYRFTTADYQQEPENLAEGAETTAKNVQEFDTEAHTVAAGAIHRRKSQQRDNTKTHASRKANGAKNARASYNVGAADSTGLYLNEIGKEELLTADEEKELAQAIEAGREAKNRLEQATASGKELPFEERRRLQIEADRGAAARDRFIRANLRLVVKFAKRYTATNSMDFQDFIQEGNLGLEHAVEKFNWRKGFKFSTYASFWIRQAIGKAIADKSRTIRLPHDRSSDLAAELRNVGGDAEQLDPEFARLEQLTNPVSLYGKIGGNNTELVEMLPDPVPGPEDEIVTSEMIQEVFGLLNSLDARAQYAIEARYGLVDGKKRSFREIGENLGINAEAARRLVHKSVEVIREEATPILED